MNGIDRILAEHMDLVDNKTRITLATINEADRDQVLASLTSRLYDNIVDKIDDIDFGSIPRSKGDITKIENYDRLVDCVELMNRIILEYKQSPAPVLTVKTAIDNIKDRTKEFTKAYAINAELPIVLYNTICLSIVASVSFLISGCIEFIKIPSTDSYSITLDKLAYKRSSQNLLFRDLERFNNCCSNGDVDKVMDNVLGSKARNLTGLDAMTVGGGLVMVVLAVNIIPILQELVFFFYHARQSVSDYFAIQADLLQANANNLQYNTDIEDEERNAIRDRQLGIVDNMRKVSNFFDIKYKKASNMVDKETSESKKKYKIDDIVAGKLDSASDSSLF